MRFVKLRIVFLAILLLGASGLTRVMAADQKITINGGSLTWWDGTKGLSGTKIPGTNAATFKVTTSASVDAGRTAEMRYQFGQVIAGTFQVFGTYIGNLSAGANQSVENTFNGAQGITYTIKVGIKFNGDADYSLVDSTGRTIKVDL